MKIQVSRDTEEYLFHPNDWNEDIAFELAKEEAKKIIFDLFPYGYVKQACKIAGMQRPRAWSTG